MPQHTLCVACFNGDYPVSVQTDFEIDTLSVPLVTAAPPRVNGNGSGTVPPRNGRSDETKVALAPERR